MNRRRVTRAVALVTVLLTAACNGLTVDQRGVHTSQPTQQVTGTYEVGRGDSLESVTVNGEAATVSPDGRWSYDMPLDGEAIFNPVVVEARFGRGEVRRERRTVVYGDGATARIVPQGERLDDAVGLRVNERAFTKLGPVIRQLTTIDTAAIAPTGTVLLDECLTQVIVCTVHARGAIAAPPTLGDFAVALDSHQDQVQAVVTLSDLHVPIDVDARILGIPSSCDLEIDAGTVTIDGRYAMGPDGVDPHNLDVNLVSGPTVTTADVTHDFTGGICSIPVIEQIVGLILPDVESLLRTNLATLLRDPDAAGPADSPVADAIEAALAQVNVAGPIGDSLGLDLDSTIGSATEDPAGINLRASALFTAASVAPEAPDLPGSVAFGDALAPIGSTSPSGRPFDIGVGTSISAFNQLLAGETERGLLNVDVTELGGQPLTLRRLFDTVGAGGIVTQDRPIAITLRPEVAPIVTTAEAPAGALGELRFHGYRVTVRTTDETNTVLAELVIDFSTGVGLTLADDGLAFAFDQPEAEDFHSDITQNPLGLPDDVVDQVFEVLAPDVFGAVGESLPRFPLPQFVGMNLSLVEVARSDATFVLYTDLVPA